MCTKQPLHVDQHEQNVATARRAHDAELEFGINTNEAAIDAANLALRALLIINGGAAIALLAFIGNLVPALQGEYATLPKIIPAFTPLMWFAFGVAGTAIAMFFAYFTNYSYAIASVDRIRNYEHPYIHETQKSQTLVTLGTVFQWFAIILSLAALIFFMIGVVEVNELIMHFNR